MIDLQELVEFTEEYSAMLDTLRQVQGLEPPKVSEGVMGLEKWFREFHQIWLTLSKLPDPERLTRFGEHLDEVLARLAGTDAPAAPLGEEALLSEEPALFRVTVTKDDGVAGDASTDCTWKYTVKSTTGTELGTKVAPEKPRYAKCAYAQPTADSPGLAWWHTDGTIKLYEALEEIPATNLVTPITSVRYDTTSHKFQYKKTSLLVLEQAAEDAAWSDITALTECDDT